ncbi:MAG: alcohol dehydrogenase [Planctomycetaceae bacterium]|nr:alcohol dehydrogenase [Planctomycetaceae bacterium]
MAKSFWSFGTPGQLLFGRKSVAQLAELATRFGWQRALIVTDQNLLDAGVVNSVQTALAAGGAMMEVFSEGEAEPSILAAEESLKCALDFRPDVIVGVGGGSNLDLSKNTAAAFTHQGHPTDYFGFDKVPGPTLPLVCIPTTAGTGSEVSHSMVLTDKAQQIKVSGQSEFFRPDWAIVDPELTYSCPRQVAADSGIDALTHAIEAVTTVEFDQLEIPPGETCAYDGRYELTAALAERAIRICGRYLEPAVLEENNFQAKDQMALAATLAGMAFSNSGVALVHALEYPMGGELHCSHGLGNGLLLPYVMQFNIESRRDTFANIAEWLGAGSAGEAEPTAEDAVKAVERLRESIGIAHRIRDIGGKEQQLQSFTEKAMKIQRLFWLNPRPASYDDIYEIYRAAF